MYDHVKKKVLQDSVESCAVFTGLDVAANSSHGQTIQCSEKLKKEKKKENESSISVCAGLRIINVKVHDGTVRTSRRKPLPHKVN